ncbi:transporter substrate-binding domain-containing protein, partial [Escherichia coli]|uniref:transporter substrate-binding domain-containing protein n=1 Tax=Escherichia coli TaxID=562 RepID=UPI002022DCEB
RYFVRNGVILQRLGPPQKVKGETLVAISFPAYQERGLEMLLRYHPEWLQGRLDRILESGVLRVATTGDYKPFSYRTEEGGYAGFDVDMAQRLAESLGAK